MGKKIIVTEKPSVARSYAKVLGVTGKGDGYIENDEWIITWCYGHLVTLCYPESYSPELKQWNMETLPFLPKEYLYQAISSSIDQFRTIKRLYNRPDIDVIYYAGDSAREGIYIQMLVRQEAGHNPKAKELVVWIDSQTDDEIRRGIREAKPLSAYENLTKSGYARAIEDYALGINLSRALTLQYRKVYYSDSSIDVGRVMTCVLGMVVRREREIRNFKATKYYRIETDFENKGDTISALWKATETSAIYEKIKPYLYNETGFKNEAFANSFMNGLGNEVKVENIELKTEKKYAPSFFNLAELQATCSRLFKISPDETLGIAQELYESQLTTYPRTDARVISTAVANEDVPRIIRGLSSIYGEFTGKISNPSSIKNMKKYVDDSKISDHYAIIPTGRIANLSGLKAQVYDLIARRFLSPFLPAAIYEKVNLDVVDTKRGEHFITSGSALKDPGYLECFGSKTDTEELPEGILSLKNGDVFPCSYKLVASETTPPSRYNSGSIILAMENAGNLIEDEELRAQIKTSGIGTSATRGAVLEKLVQKGYIDQNSKTQILKPLDFGEFVYEVVNDTVPQMLDPKMTAEWERGLSLVADGTISYEKYISKMEQFVTDSVNKIKTTSVSDNVRKIAEKLPSDGKKGATKPQAPKKSDIATYLSVSFDDKDKVKLLGARWDGKNKAWYVPAGVDIRPFAKWTGGKATTSVKKVFLEVPFENKDDAKAAGARWDNDKKKWYCMSNQDMSVLKKWIIK